MFLLCLSNSYTLKCRVCGHGDDDLGICASDSDNGKLEKCPNSLDACWYGSKSVKGDTTYFRMCGAGTGNGCGNETVDDLTVKICSCITNNCNYGHNCKSCNGSSNIKQSIILLLSSILFFALK